MLLKYVTSFRAEGVKHTDRWGHFQKHPGASTIRMLRHNAHLCRHRANCVQGQDRWKDPCTAQLSQREVFLSLIFPHFRAPLPLLCFASLLLSHLSQYWQLLPPPSTDLCKTTQPEARHILPGCRETQNSKDDDKLSASVLTVAEWLYFTCVNSILLRVFSIPRNWISQQTWLFFFFFFPSNYPLQNVNLRCKWISVCLCAYMKMLLWSSAYKIPQASTASATTSLSITLIINFLHLPTAWWSISRSYWSSLFSWLDLQLMVCTAPSTSTVACLARK